MAKLMAAVALGLLASSADAAFNFTTCPTYFETQAAKVAKGFNESKLIGRFYEQALHDYTQYPVCPSPSCITSTKAWTDVGGGRAQIRDTFGLSCFGSKPYTFPYYFNQTAHNGFLTGFIVDPPAWWKVLGFDSVYPNTIVDYEEAADGGQYAWVLEFQCRENAKGDKVKFTGFNFYSRTPQVTDEVYGRMIQSAYDAGLGVYLDSGFKIKKVPQTNCRYD
eukprot:TRINITY_DN12941_c0_g1_i1.p1 TRINITY_DN12941_c0_g1~~TRINITY_DN12941_c0_g1_i1.p1  ORF type:complete len:221 (+),score=92.66 TRINITY_DN12941_c0_g1_i1:76-738(+)